VAKADMAEKISQNEKDLKHIIEEKETAINRELQCKIAENESKLAKEKAEILGSEGFEEMGGDVGGGEGSETG
jgi:hypothetical protein